MANEVSHPPFTRVPGSRATQADLAYGTLRHAIVTWRLEPGTWLNEADLSAQSGLGRTPTREAAARLLDDGLLSVIPRSGYQVAPITLDSVTQLYDVWVPFAPMTGRLIAGRMPKPVLEALAEVAESRDLSIYSHPDAYVGFTQMLFTSILQTTGNVWLQRIGTRLMHHLQRIWVLAAFYDVATPPSPTVYASMLEAFAATDPEVGEAAFTAYTAMVRARSLDRVHRYLRDEMNGQQHPLVALHASQS